MKKSVLLFLAVILCLIVFSNEALGLVRVRGYFRKDGTYVRPHYRTEPDGILWNNLSYQGISLIAPLTYSAPRSYVYSSPEQYGEICGRVLSSSGKTIPGTAVRMHNILQPENNVVIQTSSTGEFTFIGVPAGIYNIFYDTPGYVPQMHESVTVCPELIATPPTVILNPLVTQTGAP